MKKATRSTSTSTVMSESNIRKSAARRLTVGAIVSTEIQYLQLTLTGSVTQTQLDEGILEVRRLPWTTINIPE